MAGGRELFRVASSTAFPLQSARAIKHTIGRGVKMRRLLRDERNAAFEMPGPGESLHLIVPGNFVLGDAVPRWFDLFDGADVVIATLGMSAANMKLLVGMIALGKFRRVDVLVSTQFVSQEANILAEVISTVPNDAVRVFANRSHAKIICARDAKCVLLVEGSANLRSCDGVENITILNDANLTEFTFSWFAEILAHPNTRRLW